jgi:hypothetical protein
MRDLSPMMLLTLAPPCSPSNPDWSVPFSVSGASWTSTDASAKVFLGFSATTDYKCYGTGATAVHCQPTIITVTSRHLHTTFDGASTWCTPLRAVSCHAPSPLQMVATATGTPSSVTWMVA